MKKTFTNLTMLFIALTMSTSLIAQTPTPPANGDGSSGNPYQIATLNNLYWLTQNPLVWEEPGKYFIQTANIDATATSGWDSGAGFTPIGNSESGFWGSYDGQNHTIDGLYINRPNTDFIGLFGRLQSGTLQNLGVTNVNLAGKTYTGGLVGFCIEDSPVSNCYSTGIVNGYNTVGGLLGLLNESPVSNSYSTVAVTGTNNYVGGLVGFFFENASISNCYSTGSVSGDIQVGGLVGVITLTSAVNNSYSTGSVSGNESVGGLVGLNDNSTVSNSFWDTQTSGQSSSDGGTGKTTAEMKNVRTFTDVSWSSGLSSAWDFIGNPYDDTGNTDDWSIDGSNNSGYPFLSWEAQCWIGSAKSTEWFTASNWHSGAVPTSADNVSISNTSTMPTIGGSTTANCNDLVVASGSTLTIDNDGKLTVSNDLTNSGTFTINSTSSGTGSLIVSGTATGDVTVQRYLTHDKWHYISAPVNDTRVFNTFLGLTGGTNNDQFYWWDEDGTDSGYTGIWFDILNSPTGISYTVNSFVTSQGYAITYEGIGSETISFVGVPFFANQSINITKTTGSTSLGWNLIGNPFCSTIAANNNASTNSFLSTNSGVLDGTYSGIYLWNEQASYQGNRDDYITISNSEDAKYIAVGQSFMVCKADEGSTALPFNTNMRKHGIATFYKNSEQGEVSRFYLSVENDEGLYNEILIAFIEGMTKGLDKSYDAGKLKGNPNIALYSILVEDNGFDFIHQSLPYFEEDYSVKVGLDITNTGEYTFEVATMEQIQEEVYVYFEDKLTATVTNLKETDNYTCVINESGSIKDRFVLHFTLTPFSTEEIKTNHSNIQIWSSNKTINILNTENLKGQIRIINMYGQKLIETRLNGNERQQITINIPTGNYIVNIVDNSFSVSKKIFVK